MLRISRVKLFFSPFQICSSWGSLLSVQKFLFVSFSGEKLEELKFWFSRLPNCSDFSEESSLKSLSRAEQLAKSDSEQKGFFNCWAMICSKVFIRLLWFFYAFLIFQGKVALVKFQVLRNGLDAPNVLCTIEDTLNVWFAVWNTVISSCKLPKLLISFENQKLQNNTRNLARGLPTAGLRLKKNIFLWTFLHCLGGDLR